jgi:hypothetical protein
MARKKIRVQRSTKPVEKSSEDAVPEAVFLADKTEVTVGSQIMLKHAYTNHRWTLVTVKKIHPPTDSSPMCFTVYCEKFVTVPITSFSGGKKLEKGIKSIRIKKKPSSNK